MTEHHSTAFEGSESSISSKATSSLQNPHCGQVDPIEPMSQPVSDTTLPNNRATDYIFPPILPTQEKISSTVSEDNEVTDLVICGESNANKTNVGESIILQESEETDTPFNNLNTNSTTDVCSQEVDMAEISSSQNPDQLQQKEQGSIVQDSLNSQEGQLSEWTMHHNVPGPDGTTEQTLEKNMEVRPASESLMASERDQMEVEKIPSLADALKELHNLLMSNVQACGTSPPPASHTTTSCSNSYGVNRDPAREDDASLNTNINSSSSTATTSKTVFAKSEPDTLEEDDTSEEMSVTSQGQEDDRTEGFENITQQAESHCSVLFKGGAVGENSEGLMSDMEEAPLVQDQQVGQAENGMNPDHKPLNSAEPFEEHPSSVAAGLTADSSNLVQVESTHSSTEGSELAPHPTADSTQPSTVNLTEQYPAEHIQRIQAAGFSAHEATEALELAEGSVELALLVLLARKITVPI
ncbi:uncharacterized protein LOC134316599 [Trichomycterus rosablanca]|uniref:uncharacterized protein LOC134316599 n=1 Tax=Trichomycterus rosablanca TaxID=2290929 RepID=UPI002F352EF0